VDTLTLWIVVAVVAAVVVIAAIAAFAVSRSRRRTSRLKDEFGSEYQRAVRNGDGRRTAEAELREREARVRSYELRALEPEEARRFGERWRSVQAEFVDRPGEAVQDADTLLAEVMQARGYESATARERVEDVSVGHGDEAEEYRLARASAIRNREGAASTEELRQAMLHFEHVFNAILAAQPAGR
jgi:hypothetical protein